MTNTSPYGNRAGEGSRPGLASVIDSDFLGAHLESLLIRQPPTKGSAGPVNRSELSIFGAADESPSRRPTSSKFTNTIRQMPVSPSSSRFSNSISPGDGIFGSINGAPSSVQQSRIGSNGYDYFSRASFGQAAGPSIGSKNSSTISTSFGRRPSLRKAQSHSRSISQDHTDAMSDTSSAQVSTKESVLLELALDRRASDGTNATGITSPMAESEALDWSLDKASTSRLPAGEEAADKDKELDAESEGYHSQSKPTTPYSPLPSPSRLEESGDQTTWERFKRGAVIEPPEAELNTSISASWVNGKLSSYPKYTLSMTSERRKSGVSPGRDTVKAKALKGLSAPATKVTLVPCGDDGRTFRFT